MEDGETKEDTLKREFLEEAGLLITNIKEFITIDCYWRPMKMCDMNSLAHFYIVEVSSNINQPTEKDSKLVIFDKNKTISCLQLPYQQYALKKFLEDYIDN